MSTERVAQIRAEAAREATELAVRRLAVHELSGLNDTDRAHADNAKAIEERILKKQTKREALRQNAQIDRNPCFSCGVPAHRHANYGCRKWRSLP